MLLPQDKVVIIAFEKQNLLSFCLQNTVYNITARLPISLPLDEITGLTPFEDTPDKVHYVFAKALAGNSCCYCLKFNTFVSTLSCNSQIKAFFSCQLNASPLEIH